MRKIVALVLVGLGVFLVVAGIVARAWAPGQIERTPLDTDNTTYLSGTAQVPNADLQLEKTPVLAWSTNKADADASDEDVVAFATSLCLVRDADGIDGCVDGDDPRLISAETDVFAADRHTGLTVDDPQYLPADAPHEEGLQNKWPFGAERKTYPVWDGVVGAAVDATYEGTEKIDGLETYVYRAVANADGVDVVADLPGSYASSTEYYIEPRTGAIINQVIHQQRVADGVGTVLDLDLAFTAGQVQTNVDDARDNLSLLTLIESTVPVVGLAVGIPLVLVGLGLLLLGRRRIEQLDPERAQELSGV
ncbi:DUF3068 domain-containing protein [Nocardioides sp. URHA0032]|uniref:DUF3068 domain-containing protein n=1 Tax=Nocardioides sp. URHA0032 TaxID=1380388 RepID=UPI00048E3247|nr:DUF3068 domain-containing protein [Nocardioides sp. URHA0032]